MSYGYDNANRLTSVTDFNSNSTMYSYDDAGRMTSTTLPSGTCVVSSYVDGLGSTMAIVDGSGNSQKSYTYDVYGEATPSGGLANEFDFAGQQTDATGLQYLRARYYDPETGTFLSREPMALSAGWIGHPTGYGANNPVRMTDATGLVPTDSNGCALADHGCQDRAAADEENARKVVYCGTFPNGRFIPLWQDCPDEPKSEARLFDVPKVAGLVGEYVRKALEEQGQAEAAQVKAAEAQADFAKWCVRDLQCSLTAGATAVYVFDLIPWIPVKIKVIVTVVEGGLLLYEISKIKYTPQENN